MSILRQYIAPLIAVLIFSLALVAVSARIFLPSDMAAPAPIEEDGKIGRVENNENSTLQEFVPLIAPFLENSKIYL